MNAATHDIVVEEVLAHAPETIWKTLTTAELIDRWFMKSQGFESVAGSATFPAGAPTDRPLAAMAPGPEAASSKGDNDDRSQDRNA